MIIEPIILLCASHAIDCGDTTKYVAHNYPTMQVFSNGNVGIGAKPVLVNGVRPALTNTCMLGPAARDTKDATVGDNVESCATGATATTVPTWSGQKVSKARAAKYVEPTAKLTVNGTITAKKLIIWENDACYSAAGIASSTSEECPFAPRTISTSLTGSVAERELTINWSTQTDSTKASCTASGDGASQGWTGTLDPSSQMTVTAPTTSAMTFSITCTDPTAEVSDSQTLTLTPDPDPTIGITMHRVVFGSVYHIKWSAAYSRLTPGSCQPDGAWSSNTSTAHMTPALSMNDELSSWSVTCTDATGAHSSKATVRK